MNSFRMGFHEICLLGPTGSQRSCHSFMQCYFDSFWKPQKLRIFGMGVTSNCGPERAARSRINLDRLSSERSSQLYIRDQAISPRVVIVLSCACFFAFSCSAYIRLAVLYSTPRVIRTMRANRLWKRRLAGTSTCVSSATDSVVLPPTSRDLLGLAVSNERPVRDLAPSLFHSGDEELLRTADASGQDPSVPPMVEDLLEHLEETGPSRC